MFRSKGGGTGRTIPCVSSSQGAAEQPVPAWQQLRWLLVRDDQHKQAHSYVWFSLYSLTELSCCCCRNCQKTVKCWSFPQKQSLSSSRFTKYLLVKFCLPTSARLLILFSHRAVGRHSVSICSPWSTQL